MRTTTWTGLWTAIVALALLGSLLALGAVHLGSPSVALAGRASAWPSGDCERIYTYDHEAGTARQEMVCWANDWAMTVPAPTSR